MPRLRWLHLTRLSAEDHAGLAAAVDALSGVVRKQFRVLAAGIKRVGGGAPAARSSSSSGAVSASAAATEEARARVPVPAADPWGEE